MNEEQFEGWLKKLQDAWQTLNPDAAASLCAENVVYYEDPLEPPHQGRDAVRVIWKDVPTSQKDVQMTYKILMLQGNTAIIHWHATFIRIPSNIKAVLDGIYRITLDTEALCSEFHQWWNNKTL